jgi:hypothetical protein
LAAAAVVAAAVVAAAVVAAAAVATTAVSDQSNSLFFVHCTQDDLAFCWSKLWLDDGCVDLVPKKKKLF